LGPRIKTFTAQDQGCLPTQEARSRKPWKESTILIGSANFNIQSKGSRLPAHTGSQIEEGLEGANHFDWALDMEHSLPLQDARSRKASKEPTILIGSANWNIQSAGSRFSNWNIQSAGSRSPAQSGSQIEEGLGRASHSDWVLDLKHSIQGLRCKVSA
jgi:hypothetical protein